MSRFESSEEQVAYVLKAGCHRFLPERVSPNEITDERHITKVRQEGAIACQQHLLRVVAAEATLVHFSFEILDCTGKDRLQGHTELDVSGALFRQGLSPHNTDKVRIGLEEPKASGDDVIELLPAIGRRLADRSLNPLIPLC